ncbi:MAG: translation elongation factor Ts [Bacteroidia bacterium]|nr:translation elongation factor Ts [Bacteroidia bacterium]MDW8157945.1 translation elongation factor Ts [Bacteroidia bacterium]
MNITAKEVNELRQKTGAGMMDCKKALTEANGDFEKAIEILRLKGQKVSEARKDRETKEGSVFAGVTADAQKGVIFELSCETDFVARNEDFQKLGNAILQVALSNLPADTAALLQLTFDGLTIQEHLTNAVGKIGEKIEIRNYSKIEAPMVAYYIHPGAKVGVLLGFRGNEGLEMESIAKDVCMQVAAMQPIAVRKEDVPQEIVQKEIEIGKELARQEGKPENMLEKIALGKLNKFYKEKVLLEQDFVKDPSKTIAQYLAEKSKSLQVTNFYRLHLGG